MVYRDGANVNHLRTDARDELSPTIEVFFGMAEVGVKSSGAVVDPVEEGLYSWADSGLPYEASQVYLQVCRCRSRSLVGMVI